MSWSVKRVKTTYHEILTSMSKGVNPSLWCFRNIPIMQIVLYIHILCMCVTYNSYMYLHIHMYKHTYMLYCVYVLYIIHIEYIYICTYMYKHICTIPNINFKNLSLWYSTQFMYLSLESCWTKADPVCILCTVLVFVVVNNLSL